MRILHVVHQYPPEYIGGVELNTQLVAGGLAELGHEVAVFYRRSAEGSGIDCWREESGVQVWAAYDGIVEPTRRFLATFRDTSLHQHFQHVLQETQPDIVHIQHLMGLPLTLIDWLQQQSLPYVITLHDYWWVCANAQLLTNDTEEVCDGPQLWVNCGRCALARANKKNVLWLAPAIAPLFAYRHTLLRRVIKQAKQIIVPTGFTQEIHARLGLVEPERVQVIPYGIKLHHFASHSSPKPRSAEDMLQIAYVGGIARPKGVHVLVQALTELPPEAAHLSIYGDLNAFPDYVAQLQRVATPNIEFMGRIPNDQLLGRLAEADVLVVPSIWYETAALVIQEAFTVGVPVIASDLGALQYRVRHDIDGLHVPPGDWRALRDTLQRLLKDRSILARLRAGIKMNDTIENQVKAMEAAYMVALEGVAS
ncbi:MAG: glycosyltransferase family 4 protein [Ardenticatenaceae bacterium]